jgi:predicted nucleic acid-binding protein
MDYVIDTHALIWYFTGSPRLSKSMVRVIDKCISSGEGIIFVPTIVLTESLDISQKKRVAFDFDEMYKFIKENPVFEIVDFSQYIFEETPKIKKALEIHDKIIYATARIFDASIITKDGVLKDIADTVW